MPFLHLDSRNRHKKLWEKAVDEHPASFEILEWSIEQERDLIQRNFPAVDTQLFPRSCISIAASLQRLMDYGGISVRGEDVAPTRGLKILLLEWKMQGPPNKLTVRGYAYPVFIDKSTIMSSTSGDAVCKKYRDLVIANLTEGKWEHPVFDSDVAIM